MKVCEVCGSPHTEKHHVIFRSQFKGLDVDWNLKYLCPTHHRGNLSPHRNKTIDTGYKREVQQYLMQTLTQDYYIVDEIAEVLQLTKNVARKICKLLHVKKDGYKREDIILRIMGRDYLE